MTCEEALVLRPEIAACYFEQVIGERTALRKLKWRDDCIDVIKFDNPQVAKRPINQSRHKTKHFVSDRDVSVRPDTVDLPFPLSLEFFPELASRE